MLCFSMELPEETKAAKDLIQALLKARKTVRMYPGNNPVYTKTIDDVLSRFHDFFSFKNDLDLRIKQNEILIDSEQIYHNPEKEDNLALFFFKDGLRELSFTKGLSEQELEEFLKIIAHDFDREAVDDDIVTLLWERDFQNIKYVVDEAFILEDDTYEQKAVAEVKDRTANSDDLLRAYADAFTAEEITEVSIINLSDKDLQILVREIERDMEEKTEKLSGILFEMLFQADTAAEFDDVYRFLIELIMYALGGGDLKTVAEVLRRAKESAESAASETLGHHLRRLTNIMNSPESIRRLGEIFDSADMLDETLLHECVSFFDKSAIPPLISLLGDLKSIHGRKQVMAILISLGEKDLQAIARGLNDSRWYVVRNIIYILRHIGDKKAVEYLLNTARHSDARVRRESIKALGELRSPLALQTLKECLDDLDPAIRKSVAKALGDIGSETAKRILLQKVAEKDFQKRDFEEKRDFFEAIARWNDTDVADFMVKILGKNSIFKRARSEENKACAAYCLGLMGSRDTLSALSRLADSKNKLLREHVTAAIKRIEHGR